VCGKGLTRELSSGRDSSTTPLKPKEGLNGPATPNFLAGMGSR
jgi:hypothetical protein